MSGPKSRARLPIAASLLMLLFAAPGVAKKADKAAKKAGAAEGRAMLWTEPTDIKSRNLFYGPGTDKDAPHTTFAFEKEDTSGTSPKFIVKDEDGVRWKGKMGPEARPETVASRLVWAVGYTTDEDYFVPELHVENLPSQLHRGQQFVGLNGTLRAVRLKRYLKGQEKVGNWRWSANPFASTRELNGLRVVMALINNWDLKDVNNAIYSEKQAQGSDEARDVYVVSDLGASFGTTGVSWRRAGTDGELDSYSSSKFVSKATPQYVDFATPSIPFLLDIFYPPDFFMRVHMRWLGKRVPRDDVRWMAQLLVQLSPQQIRDSFRAAGYSPDQIEGFAKVVESRIAALNKL